MVQYMLPVPDVIMLDSIRSASESITNKDANTGDANPPGVKDTLAKQKAKKQETSSEQIGFDELRRAFSPGRERPATAKPLLQHVEDMGVRRGASPTTGKH